MSADSPAPSRATYVHRRIRLASQATDHGGGGSGPSHFVAAPAAAPSLLLCASLLLLLLLPIITASLPTLVAGDVVYALGCVIAVTTTDGSTLTVRCSNHGKCVALPEGREACQCQPGFTGTYCEYYAECQTDADCFRGTCNTANGSCTCAQGWHGAHCMLQGVQFDVGPELSDTQTTQEWARVNPLQYIASSPPSPATTPALPPMPKFRVQMLYPAAQLGLADGSLVTQIHLRYDHFRFPSLPPATSATSDSNSAPAGTLTLSNLRLRLSLVDASVNNYNTTDEWFNDGFTTVQTRTSYTAIQTVPIVSKAYFTDSSVWAAIGNPGLNSAPVTIANVPDLTSSLASSTSIHTGFEGVLDPTGWLRFLLPKAAHFTWDSRFNLCLDLTAEGMTLVYPQPTVQENPIPTLAQSKLAVRSPTAIVGSVTPQAFSVVDSGGSFALRECGHPGCMLASVSYTDAVTGAIVNDTRVMLPALIPLRLGSNLHEDGIFIQSITPPSGSALGGTEITVTGANFPVSSDDVWQSVFLADQACTNLRRIDNVSFACTTPVRELHDTAFPSQVPYTLKVQALSSGLRVSQSNPTATFTYSAPPIIYDLTPTSGGPGTRIRLIGAYLGQNAKDVLSIMIGNITCGSIEYTSSSLVTCTVGIPASYKEQVDLINAIVSSGNADDTDANEFRDLAGGEQVLPVVVTTASGGSSLQNDAGNDGTSTTPSSTKLYTFQTPPILRVSAQTGNDTLCVEKTSRCATLGRAMQVYGRAGATFFLEPGVYVERYVIPILFPQISIQSLSSDPTQTRIRCNRESGCFSYGEDWHELDDAASTSSSTSDVKPQLRYFYPRLISGITFEQDQFVYPTDADAPISPAAMVVGIQSDLSPAAAASATGATVRVTRMATDAASPNEMAAMVNEPLAVPSNFRATSRSIDVITLMRTGVAGDASAGVGALFHLNLKNSLPDTTASCGGSASTKDIYNSGQSVSTMVEQNMQAISGSTTIVTVDANNVTTVVAPLASSSSPLVFKNCVFQNVASANGPMILVDSSNVVFQNCTFIGNTNTFPSLAGSGGALYVADGSSVVLQQCAFFNNQAAYGGAILAMENSRLSIVDTTFSNNVATQSGGALYLTAGCILNVTSSTFSNSHAGVYGGAMYVEKSTLFALQVTLIDNSAGLTRDKLASTTILPSTAVGGGAIRSVVSTLVLDTVAFERNNAGWPAVGDGGAISATYSDILVSKSSFTSNLAARGGAIAGETLSSISLTTCTFGSNVAGFASAQLTFARSLGWNVNASLNLASGLSGEPSRWGLGGAMYWSGFVASYIDTCKFTDNIGNDGGALYLDRASGSTAAASSTGRYVMNMQRANFERNLATGRNISALAGTLQTLAGLSTTRGNGTVPVAPVTVEMTPFAMNGGGAIVSVSTAFQCDRCRFVANAAPRGGGGALLWQDDWALGTAGWRADGVTSANRLLPTFFPPSINIPVNFTLWANNTALYGPEFATVASAIRAAVRQTDPPYAIVPIGARFTTTASSPPLPPQSSGTVFHPQLSVELLDAYGHRVSPVDAGSNGLTVRVIASQLASDKPFVHPTLGVLTNNLAQTGAGIRYFVAGLANFTDLGLLSLPGSNVSLTFETLLHTGQIVTTYSGSTAGIGELAAVSPASVVVVQIEQCMPGEMIDLNNNRCVACPAGTTSFTSNSFYCVIQEDSISWARTYALVIFFAILLLLELGAMAGVVYFRKHRVIFSASPLFCVMILAGGIMCLLGAILLVQQPIATGIATCVSTVWLLNLGFMICYGSMVSKTYRLYRIFDNALFAPVAITNRQLVSGVLALCLFDTLVIGIWQAVAPPFLRIDQYRECDSSLSHVFPPMLIATKALLIAYGAFLTYKVRGIPSTYNESRFLAAAFFIVGLLAFVVLGLQWGLGNSGLTPPTLNIIQSIGVALGSFCSVAFIFTPHFVNIYLARLESRKNAAIRQMELQLKAKRVIVKGGGSGGSLTLPGSSGSVSVNSGEVRPMTTSAPTPDGEVFRHTDVVVDAADYLLPPLPIPEVISHLIKQFTQKAKRHPLEQQFVLCSSDLNAATRAEAISLKRLSENRKDIIENLRKLSQLHFEIEFQKQTYGGLDEREAKVYDTPASSGTQSNRSSTVTTSARSRGGSSGATPTRRNSLHGAATTAYPTVAFPTANTTPRVSTLQQPRPGSYEPVLVDEMAVPASVANAAAAAVGVDAPRRDSNAPGSSSNPLSVANSVANTPNRTPLASRRPSHVELQILSTIRDDPEVLSPEPDSRKHFEYHGHEQDADGVAAQNHVESAEHDRLNTERVLEALDSHQEPSPPLPAASPTGIALTHPTSSPVPSPSLSPSPLSSSPALSPSPSPSPLPPVPNDVENPSFLASPNAYNRHIKPPLPKKMRSVPRTGSSTPQVLSPDYTPIPSNPRVNSVSPLPPSVSPTPLSPPPRGHILGTMRRRPASPPPTSSASPVSSTASNASPLSVTETRPKSKSMLAPYLRIHPAPTRHATAVSTGNNRVSSMTPSTEATPVPSPGSTPAASPGVTPSVSPTTLSRRLPHTYPTAAR